MCYHHPLPMGWTGYCGQTPKCATTTLRREGGQNEAAMAKPLNVLPPPSADRVDMMYHQLAEIHAIASMQLTECALVPV
jgi:hypothetical protein